MNPRTVNQHRGAKSILVFFVLIFGILTGIFISNGLDWIPSSIAQSRYSGDGPASVEPSSFLTSTQESFREIVEAVRPAVVSIQAEGTQTQSYYDMQDPFEYFFNFPDPFNQNPNPRPGPGDRGQNPQAPQEEYPVYASASGFLVAPDGYILTNHHVIADATDITVTLDDGDQYHAQVIGDDPDTDVAILKIEDDHAFPYLQMADSDGLQVGDWVMAIGNPFGYLAGTVTVGIVSATNREQLALEGGAYYQDFIQTDAAINFGNSGGPLVDIYGRAVGINTAISAQGSGIGFAIPMNIATFVYNGFLQNGEVVRSWVGVTIQNLDPDLASALGLSSHEGALIASVNPGDPADEAGLKEGDVILKVGGTTVVSTASASRVIAELPVGEPAEFVIWRDDQEMTIVVTPAQRESSALQANDQETNGQDEGNSQNDKPRPESNANYLGIEVEELTSDLIESYGLPEDTTGVVVASIEPTSSAWEKGLMEGSVIVMINDGEVQNLDDYDRLMSAAHDEWQSSGRNVILRYLQPDPSGNWIRFFVALPFED